MQQSLNVSAKPLSTGEIRVEPDTGYVYEAYDATSTPLYVGATNDLSTRLAWHRSYSDWYASAARIVWTQYATRAIAGRAEIARIRALMPRHNSQFNPVPQAAPEPPNDGNWVALGTAVRAARQKAGRTQRSISRDTGITPADLRLLEAGGGVTLPGEALARLEHALGWTDESALTVLGGGEPVRLSREERQRRALSAVDNINVMAGV